MGLSFGGRVLSLWTGLLFVVKLSGLVICSLLSGGLLSLVPGLLFSVELVIFVIGLSF